MHSVNLTLVFVKMSFTVRLQCRSKIRFTPENSRNKDVFVLERWYLDTLISVQISSYEANSTKTNVFLSDCFPPVIKWLVFLVQNTGGPCLCHLLAGGKEEGNLQGPKRCMLLPGVLQPSLLPVHRHLSTSQFLSEARASSVQVSSSIAQGQTKPSLLKEQIHLLSFKSYLLSHSLCI